MYTSTGALPPLSASCRQMYTNTVQYPELHKNKLQHTFVFFNQGNLSHLLKIRLFVCAWRGVGRDFRILIPVLSKI